MNSELRHVVETQINDLYDSYSKEDVSYSDAFTALQGIFHDLPDMIFKLTKEYLNRCFYIIGRKDEKRAVNDSEGRKLARQALFDIIFNVSSSTSDPIVESTTPINVDSSDIDEEKSDENVSSDEEKKKSGKTSTGARSSPRKTSSNFRVNRKLILEQNKIHDLEEQIKKLHAEKSEVKDNSISEITAALQSIPTMGKNSSGKNVKSKLSKEKHVLVDAGKRSKRKTDAKKKKKKAKVKFASSSSDSSSSESSSSSSSSSSSDTSDSSDSSGSNSDVRSSRSSRRRRRRHRSKHSRTTSTRYAKALIRNVGRDGCVTYVQRIVMATQNLGKKVDQRSVHEAVNIGAALDAFLSDGINPKLDGMEILGTRFIGLVQVVRTGDWSFMEGIQYKPAGADSLPLSTSEMKKIMKNGIAISAMSNSSNVKRQNSKLVTATPATDSTTWTPSSNSNQKTWGKKPSQSATAGTNAEKVGTATEKSSSVSK